MYKFAIRYVYAINPQKSRRKSILISSHTAFHTFVYKNYVQIEIYSNEIVTGGQFCLFREMCRS